MNLLPSENDFHKAGGTTRSVVEVALSSKNIVNWESGRAPPFMLRWLTIGKNGIRSDPVFFREPPLFQPQSVI